MDSGKRPSLFPSRTFTYSPKRPRPARLSHTLSVLVEDRRTSKTKVSTRDEVETSRDQVTFPLMTRIVGTGSPRAECVVVDRHTRVGSRQIGSVNMSREGGRETGSMRGVTVRKMKIPKRVRLLVQE